MFSSSHALDISVVSAVIFHILEAMWRRKIVKVVKLVKEIEKVKLKEPRTMHERTH